jgi:drug/metabolite transporter (DMT)-like permease
MLALYALFGTTFILGKEAVSVVPPVFFIGIRMVLASALLLIFIVLFQKGSLKIKRKDLPWFGGIILFHIYFAYVLEFIGLQYLTGSKTCLLYNLSPFITALFSYWFFGEVMTKRKWIGLSIGFAAFLPTLISQEQASEAATASFGFVSYPEILLLISVVSACAGWIFMRKLTRERGYSYFFVNTVGMLGGGILALGTSYSVESWPSYASLITNIPFLRSLFLLILIGNIICFNLYGSLLATYSATILSFFGFVTPLFAALFGWLWLGETVSWSFYVTVFFVGFGLYEFYQEELKQGYILK